MIKCPCGSKKTYNECCESIIINTSASTALTLMRSRYTAYQSGQVTYLLETTHAKTRDKHNFESIKKWSEDNTWVKLEVISVEHGRINDNYGIVEFKAHYIDTQGKAQTHHEKSSFIKENKQWYYVEGSFDPKPVDLSKKISRNDPCPCGSGKKLKKCCG